MQVSISAPKYIDSVITLPASKSISNRALIINALAGSNNVPENLSCCDDTDVTVAALRDMPYEIDIKACGTAMRFLTAYLSSTPCGEHIITGTERMKHRPIGLLVDAMRSLGADITYLEEEGFPPLKIVGRNLEGGHISVPGHISSQFISALLMVGPVFANGLTIHLTSEVISRPYIDLTICTMQEFGAEVEWVDAATIAIKPKPYKAVPFIIENDWSAASYWYEILALQERVADAEHEGMGKVVLPGLLDGSRQGDSSIRYIFSMLGIKTRFEDNAAILTPHKRMLPRLDIDFVNHPDLAQTAVVATALMNIPFRFTGLKSLRIKETDRIAALKTEIAKLGYVLDDSQEGVLSWDGTKCEPMAEPVIDTYEDHRMAMAFAPACIMFPGLKIDNPGVVSKSYPNFWNDLKKVGFQIEEIN
jgi:3-phosphoshikimate 1-carboxyvinyltransferase